MSTFRPSHLNLAILIALGVAAPVTALQAQQQAPEGVDTIVVTASGFEQKITDAPASVSVIGRDQLQTKPYTSLADALRDIEGIDVGSGQDKNGNISVTMRGLPADYTLILIDGRRQSDVGDIGPNNFGNSQFMYMPPLEAIERIEIVRGPMSTLYGADAIGGVMNIITRKVVDEWHGSTTLSSSFQQDDQYGDDRKADVYLTGPIIPDLLGVGFRASIYEREESEPTYSESLLLPDGSLWEDSGSFGDKKIVAAKNWNAGLTFNLTPHEDHDFSLELDVAKQRYDNTEGQTGTLDGTASLWRASGGIVQPRVGYTEYQRVQRQQAVVAHTGRWSIGTSHSSLTASNSENLGRSLPLTVQERGTLQQIWDTALVDQGNPRTPVLTDEISAQLQALFLPRPLRTLEISNLIFDTRLEMEFGNHAMVVGGQYFDAEMEDGVFGMYGDGFRKGTTQDHTQWALFAEDNWDIVEALTLTTGARFDDHNVFGEQISPRAYLTYRPTSAWTVKGGVSTGYKTPKPNQLFEGITGFGGQGVSPFVGTPDLQPETSINYEVAAYYDNGGRFSGNITSFMNDFKDKIVNQDNLPNCEVSLPGADCVDVGEGWADLGYISFRQAGNVDKSTTKGVEIAGTVRITDTIDLKANYTYTESTIESGPDKGQPLVNTPRDMINATLSWNAMDRLTLSLISEIRSERYRGTIDVLTPAGVETREQFYEAYDIYHLAANYDLSDSLKLNARISNLADDDLSSRSCELVATGDAYSCTADYNTTEKARSFWLSMSYNF